jgi:hypothetical protein
LLSLSRSDFGGRIFAIHSNTYARPSILPAELCFQRAQDVVGGADHLAVPIMMIKRNSGRTAPKTSVRKTILTPVSTVSRVNNNIFIDRQLPDSL